MNQLKYLKNIEYRHYQHKIFQQSKDQNTLIVLPTGLGKTIIIGYLLAYHLEQLMQNPKDEKLVVVTPTKPLVQQLVSTFREILELIPEEVQAVDGRISPSKRPQIYNEATIITGTPHTIARDLLASRLSAEKIRFIAIDEAHRATGNYPSAQLITLLPPSTHIVGLTATPGNTQEQVLQIVKTLRAKKVVYYDESDPEVKKHASVHRPRPIFVDLPDPYKKSLKLLDQYIQFLLDELDTVLDLKLTKEKRRYLTRKTALEIHHHVIKMMHDDLSIASASVYTGNLIRALHLKDIIESQGFPQAKKMIITWEKKQDSKAKREFFENSLVQQVLSLIDQHEDLAHPKLTRLLELLFNWRAKNPQSKIIVFSNYRATVSFLSEVLEEKGFPVAKFTGHGKSASDKRSLSQKEQLEIVERFKHGDIDILVSTSVGEEGLDVGNCDLVIFYDSVPSMIRAIQRRGRGRKKFSQIIHLITKNTRDAGLYYSMKRKEQKMRDFLKDELPLLLHEMQEKSEEEATSDSVEVVFVETTRKDQTFSNKVNNLAKGQLTLKDIEPQKKSVTRTTNSQTETISTKKISDENGREQEKTPSSNLVTTDAKLKAKAREMNSQKSEFKPLIIADSRESSSALLYEIKKRNVNLELKFLMLGDFIIPPNYLIERKSYDDFIASIIDGRLFNQAKALKAVQDRYPNLLYIVEGEPEHPRNLSPQAFTGALLSLLFDYEIPIYFSKNYMETADTLILLAKKAQQDSTTGKYVIHSLTKSTSTIHEIQEALLANIPGINRETAIKILKHFGSLSELSTATLDELMKVEGIGPTLSKRIYDIFRTTYKKS